MAHIMLGRTCCASLNHLIPYKCLKFSFGMFTQWRIKKAFVKLFNTNFDWIQILMNHYLYHKRNKIIFLVSYS